MDAPHPCLHCALHDMIQWWIDTHGHPGAVEIVRCLTIVEWDIKQTAEWADDGLEALMDGLQTHH